jgi:LacI family transcriptional regulator
MATLKDVAARCGFSASTVSYALRDNPRIPEETRTRIKSVAAELGYQRDAHLGQLMAHLKSRRQQVQACPIAWINSAPNPLHWRETPWAREFYDSALQRAREQGFAMNEIWVHDQGLPHSRLDEVLKARGMRGLILSTPLQGQEWTHGSTGMRTPSSSWTTGSPASFDHVYALYWQICAWHWNRSSCAVTPPEALAERGGRLLDRLRLHIRMPRQNRLRPDLEPILTPPARDSPASRSRPGWRSSGPMWSSPHPTLGGLLRELGLRIPEDLGYLAMYVLNDDSLWSGVSQLHQQQSVIAVDRLAGLLQMNTVGRRPTAAHTDPRTVARRHDVAEPRVRGAPDGSVTGVR